jgi:hypothetical protein
MPSKRNEDFLFFSIGQPYVKLKGLPHGQVENKKNLSFFFFIFKNNLIDPCLFLHFKNILKKI